MEGDGQHLPNISLSTRVCPRILELNVITRILSNPNNEK